jgi:hypothetical protein
MFFLFSNRLGCLGSIVVTAARRIVTRTIERPEAPDVR